MHSKEFVPRIAREFNKPALCFCFAPDRGAPHYIARNLLEDVVRGFLCDTLKLSAEGNTPNQGKGLREIPYSLDQAVGSLHRDFVMVREASAAQRVRHKHRCVL